MYIFFRNQLLRGICFIIFCLYGGFVTIVAERIGHESPWVPTAMVVWNGFCCCIFAALVHLAALWILYLCKLFSCKENNKQ